MYHKNIGACSSTELLIYFPCFLSHLFFLCETEAKMFYVEGGGTSQQLFGVLSICGEGRGTVFFWYVNLKACIVLEYIIFYTGTLSSLVVV